MLSDSSNLLNNYIAQGVNGLVYAATDATAMNEVSTDVTKAGVKVVSIDSGTTPQPSNVPLIATNNISGAKLAADRLAEAIGPAGGKIAIIAFHAGSQTNDQRVQGFQEELKKYPKLHLIGTQYSQNDYNTALTVTAHTLDRQPRPQGAVRGQRGQRCRRRGGGSDRPPRRQSQDRRLGHLAG